MGVILSIGKYFILIFLSLVQSFNYINHLPFILLYLYIINDLNFLTYIYLTIILVIYDITKYFFKLISIKMMRLIGIHEFLSFSLGLLIIIQVGFSFIFYYYKSLLMFIVYRILLSLFNNLSSFIIYPISRLYNNKKINNRLESFSFYQKIFNFLIFPLGIVILTDLNSFSNFCLILSIINIFGFILYLITFMCNYNNKERQYYPQVSEKVPNKNNNIINIIKEQNNKISQIITNKKECNKLKSSKNNINSENFGDNTNLAIISGEIKNKIFLNHNKNIKNNNININISENHEASINFYKNISDIDNRKTKNNFIDNSLKNKLYQKNNSNINNSEIINKIESSSDVVLGQFYGDNNNKNKSKFDINHNNSYQKPASIKTNKDKNHISKNINNINTVKNSSLLNNHSNNNKKNIKIKISNKSFIYLIIINSIFKFIHFFSMFLLLIKFYEVKNFMNENKIYNINTSLIEIMILFGLYYFINIFLFIINKFLTSFIVKGGCFIKYIVFYLLQVIYLISLLSFIFIFVKKNLFNRKNIIINFIIQLIISENSMILLIYYNKLAVNKGLNQKILKETKSLGILIGAVLFILFNIGRGIFLYIIKMKIYLFDNYLLYIVFLIFFVFLFIIGIIF